MANEVGKKWLERQQCGKCKQLERQVMLLKDDLEDAKSALKLKSSMISDLRSCLSKKEQGTDSSMPG